MGEPVTALAGVAAATDWPQFRGPSLDGISDEEIVGLNIPTGIPLVYELDEALRATDRYYLGDPEKARAAADAVANQARN